ncbi:MAG: reverse transcriptase domain-containing protein [Candidatus Thiodiazotropha endolucinida]|nr:reverse transcriptase domain-containing protein [Candidatus Thiodiazotropha endolucinida]
MKSRSIYPEFLDFVTNYDFLGLQETKTDSLDNIDLPGFKLFLKHRKTISRSKSGGIGLAYKAKFEKFIRIIDSDSTLVLWFVLSKHLTRTKDLLCGIIYIPPENSAYANVDPYFEIAEELSSFENMYSDFLLFGDWNSRSKNMPDYISIHQSVFHANDLDIVFDELKAEAQLFKQQNLNVTLKRHNSDKVANNYGNKLLDFCKSNSLYILNGRTKGDLPVGKFTCKNVSVVDYFVCSSTLLKFVSQLNVTEFCSLLSDAHCPVALCLNYCTVPDKSSEGGESSRLKLWDTDKVDQFREKVACLELARVLEKLICLENQNGITQSDIDLTVDSINDIFTAAAECSFGYTHIDRQYTEQIKKPTWYGPQCKSMRKKWHRAKYLYKFNKSNANKESLKNASNAYKNTMKQNYTKFKRYNIKKLRGLKNSNPKIYWKIINGKKQESVKATVENLFDYFKKVNSGGGTAYGVQGNIPINMRHTNEEINRRITLDEITKQIRKLKNNKAGGIDCLINEHLKSTVDLMGSVYEKLFNLILDTGIFPKVWTLGMIKPIYKQKGDASAAGNYRPITLLSSLGKLFTGIISDRLHTYAESNDMISCSQAGFRKEFSTADNIFVLYCLTEIVNLRKKKLFAAFIDLKQAFDTVWRDGLWNKLVNCNITGKCYQLITNMYNDIKSCILVNNKQTDFFSCNIGLRQGENLSPFLFSIYLNDLDNFFMHEFPSGGIECFSAELDDRVYIYLKLFILLYADDTVILGESSEGLQTCLNLYNDYCNQWKLQINIDKSKIVIFAKGRQARYDFTLNNEKLDVVSEYKYLGILFSRTGTFNAAKKHLAAQAEKAMYNLIRKSRSLLLPVDLQIELFEKMVKPILLYGAEVWGFGNNCILEKVCLKYLKMILNMKTSTPNCMVYGETGVFPIFIDIECRVIAFWAKLVTPNTWKLSSLMYDIIHSLYKFNDIGNKFKWLTYVKEILTKCGMSGIWETQQFPNAKWLTAAVKQKLKDIYITEWYSTLNTNSSNVIYRIIKTQFCLENYLVTLPSKLRKKLIQMRTRNHRLPVETGRWQNIPKDERLCTFCKTTLGDEFHVILECQELKEIRSKYIQQYYYRGANTIKFNELMNTNNKRVLYKLCSFINEIFSKLK